VMVLVVAGLLNKEIAYEIGVTEPTVKAHRGQVMRKMRARSVAELVRVADKLKLSHPKSKASSTKV
jgi:FixJ family two-component response regulator